MAGPKAMTGMTGKSFDMPDERRTPPQTQVDMVRLGDQAVARLTLQPGWRWLESLKPLMKTESCEKRHVGAVLSGVVRVMHRDGTEMDMRPGMAYVIEPGHDAWVVGDEPAVALEFESAETYAKP